MSITKTQFVSLIANMLSGTSAATDADKIADFTISNPAMSPLMSHLVDSYEGVGAVMTIAEEILKLHKDLEPQKKTEVQPEPVKEETPIQVQIKELAMSTPKSKEVPISRVLQSGAFLQAVKDGEKRFKNLIGLEELSQEDWNNILSAMLQIKADRDANERQLQKLMEELKAANAAHKAEVARLQKELKARNDRMVGMVKSQQKLRAFLKKRKMQVPEYLWLNEVDENLRVGGNRKPRLETAPVAPEAEWTLNEYINNMKRNNGSLGQFRIMIAEKDGRFEASLKNVKDAILIGDLPFKDADIENLMNTYIPLARGVHSEVCVQFVVVVALYPEHLGTMKYTTRKPWFLLQDNTITNVKPDDYDDVVANCSMTQTRMPKRQDASPVPQEAPKPIPPVETVPEEDIPY